MMARIDLGFAFLWVLLGAAISAESLRLGLFGMFGPDRGFFPFLAGLIMALGGLALALSADNRLPRDYVAWPHAAMAVRVVTTICLLALLVALMPWAGFFLAAALVTPVMVRVVGGARWKTALMVGVGTPVVITVLFTVVLDTPLPRGVLRGLF